MQSHTDITVFLASTNTIYKEDVVEFFKMAGFDVTFTENINEADIGFIYSYEPDISLTFIKEEYPKKFVIQSEQLKKINLENSQYHHEQITNFVKKKLPFIAVKSAAQNACHYVGGRIIPLAEHHNRCSGHMIAFPELKTICRSIYCYHNSLMFPHNLDPERYIVHAYTSKAINEGKGLEHFVPNYINGYDAPFVFRKANLNGQSNIVDCEIVEFPEIKALAMQVFPNAMQIRACVNSKTLKPLLTALRNTLTTFLYRSC